MLARLALRVSTNSPTMRRVLWRWWYERLARTCAEPEWTFMNYGWLSREGRALHLQPPDEPHRMCIQLYERVVMAADLADADVLEIGCGRGGGASYLARYHRTRSMTGIDYSPGAVAFCRHRHAAVRELSFQVADAERLPFPAGSFDAVVNIESSHCYGDVSRFLTDAARVLRPGGWFLFADARPAARMPELAAQIAAQPEWQICEHEDITVGVAAALLADDARKRRMIAEVFPPKSRQLFSEFAALEGTPMFHAFHDRRMLYGRWACRKCL